MSVSRITTIRNLLVLRNRPGLLVVSASEPTWFISSQYFGNDLVY